MTETDAPISHVSDTAFLVAQFRAAESARPDALFIDPFAARLSGPKGRAIGNAMVTRAMTAWSIAVRTVLIDDFILEEIANGVDTVLNLGAGLDARPYRLDLPEDLVWIEADYPDVVAYKNTVLAGEAPRCRLECVPIDLANDAKRRVFFSNIGSRRTRKLLVLTEGVVPYLDNEQVATLADDLRDLAHSVEVSWILEYLPKRVYLHRRRAAEKRQMKNAPFKFRPDDWFHFFASHGWKQRTIRYLGHEGIKRGRRAPLPWRTRSIMAVVRFFRRKRDRGRVDRLLGYAILEPTQIKG